MIKIPKLVIILYHIEKNYEILNKIAFLIGFIKKILSIYSLFEYIYLNFSSNLTFQGTK